MKAFAICVCCLSLASGAYAQRDGQAKRRALGNGSSAPVRVSEVNATFVKYERVLRKILALPGGTASTPSKDQTPATRTQILNGFNRLFEMCRPEFKVTPRDFRYDPNLFILPKGNPQRPILEKLVKWGCVGKVGVLATSKEEKFTLAEFGEAMGLFLIRMADLTHTPSTKWSPFLNNT